MDIARLAHPRHRGAGVDLDRVAPEALEDGALALVQERRGDRLPAFGEPVDLTLQLGLEQVGDEVVVVRAQHLRQHPAWRMRGSAARVARRWRASKTSFMIDGASTNGIAASVLARL